VARRWLLPFATLVLVAAVAFALLTMPRHLAASEIAPLATADSARGERLFWAGGCASCHAAKGAKGADRLKLGGGAPLVTKFGTFHAPNISPHLQDGIGGWNLADFANAMQRGVSPDGHFYYPAFPYTSYARMRPGDVADLYAYLRTLPPVSGKAPANDVGFPFNIRRGIGLWQLLFLSPKPVLTLPAGASPAAHAGQYLVEGPGHCGECHSPRSLGGLGGTDTARWLGGAPALEGDGRIPNITPGGLSWSADEIADYLETGFTPDYDSVGGSMVEVQENMAQLSDTDRAAIGAYLKAIPPVANPPAK
jgi:mono/diheme cytochrome c family protein